MQTVLIYDTFGQSPLRFLILDGDYSHLNNIYVNVDYDSNLTAEIEALVTNDSWRERKDFLYEFPIDAVKDGAKVVIVGWCY